MKHEKSLNCLAAALMAFCIAFSGVGCMVTGLKLQVSSMWTLAVACAAAAAVSALCGRFAYGGWALAAVSVLGGFLLLKPERAALLWDQTLAMLHRMTALWNFAYGWPLVPMGSQQTVDLPLMLIGTLVAVITAGTVCRQKRAFGAVAAALIPLASCLVVTDTAPDTGYLFGLLLGLAVLMLSNSVRRFDLGQGLELTAMAAVAAALGLTLLFGFAPREDYVNNVESLQDEIVTWAQELPAQVKEWGQIHAPGTGDSAQTQRENLSTLGRRIQRDYPVLEVTSDISGRIYLRGQDFDSYDGKSWTASRTRSEEFRLSDGAAAFASDVEAQITVDALRYRSVRYVPYYPQSGATFVGGRISNEEKQRVYPYTLTTLADDWKDKLQAVSFVPDPNTPEGIQLTAGLYDSAKEQWRYRNLPLDTQTRAGEIVNGILTEERTVTEKADAIAAYVRGSASYNLDPGTMPPEENDFALWFLEKQTQGYCVHFATATAVLLRAAGIDARYVTGYMLEARAGETVSVSAKQSHAWVEYFEPVLGTWVVLESTPADLSEDPAGTAAALPSEATGPAEPETTPLRPEETGRPKPDVSVPSVPDDGSPAQEGRPAGFGKALSWLLLPLLAAAALWGQYRLRREVRRKRQTTGNPNRRGLALWEESVLLHRLLKAAPPEALEALAQKAKFSQHDLTREELRILEDSNRETRQKLQQKSLLHRWIHRLVFAAY